jgi:hypothetical protein
MPSDEIHLVEPEARLETPRLLLEPLLLAHALSSTNICRTNGRIDFSPGPSCFVADAGRLLRIPVVATLPRWPRGLAELSDARVALRRLRRYPRGHRTRKPDGHDRLHGLRSLSAAGLAAEACGRLLEHLLEDYRVGVVAAEIDTRKVASIALVESLGFERVAFHKDADHFKGSSSDEYRYELKESAWAEKRARL